MNQYTKHDTLTKALSLDSKTQDSLTVDTEETDSYTKHNTHTKTLSLDTKRQSSLTVKTVGKTLIKDQPWALTSRIAFETSLVSSTTSNRANSTK